jgi:DNA modification methylase
MKILINCDSSGLKYPKVDLLLTDPPYGITNNAWDHTPADFIEGFMEFMSTDSMIVTTSSMRYSAFLLSKYLRIFHHDLVWKKTVGSGQLNINNRPLTTHEQILVFKIGKGVYNRIKVDGAPYNINRDIKSEDSYNKQKPNSSCNTGQRDTKSILEVSNPRIKGGHPTEKPLELWEKLFSMYAKGEDSVVLDPFCGAGNVLDLDSTVIAVEKEQKYYELARNRRLNRVAKEGFRVPDELQEFVQSLQSIEHTIFES